MFSIDQDTREISAKGLVHDYRQLVQTQTVIERGLLMTPLAKAQLGDSKGESSVDIVSLMAQHVDETAEPKAVVPDNPSEPDNKT